MQICYLVSMYTYRGSCMGWGGEGERERDTFVMTFRVTKIH